MSRLELTRRQLLQAGGVVMVSSLLPASFNAFAAEAVASPAELPLDRVDSFISPHRRRPGDGVQWPRRSGHRHSHRAGADRRR